MKKSRLIPILCLSLSCASAPSARGTRSRPTEAAASGPREGAPAPVASTWTRTPPPGALDAVERQEDRRATYTLANGLRVVVVRHGERPLVALSLVFPRGAAADSDQTAGATFFAARLLAERYELTRGGRDVMDERTLRQRFSDAGGALDVTVTADQSAVTVQGYRQDLRRYLDLLAEAIRKPRQGKYTFLGYRDSILDNLEDAELQQESSFREFLNQASFGQGHVYARPVFGTTKSLMRLQYDDIQNAQALLLNPKGATLLVVGAVEPADVFGAVESAFGPWTGAKPAPPVRIRAPEVRPRKTVAHVVRAPSTTLLMCAARPLSDVAASPGEVELMAEILGVGIESRLNQSLRETHGLTYGASASVLRRRAASALLMCARLRGDGTQLGMRVLLETLATLRSTPPTEDELRRARGTLLGRFDEVGDELGGVLQAELDGLATNRTIAERRVAIHAVTLASLQPVLEKVLEPSKLQIILAGEAQPARAAVQVGGLGGLEPLRLGDR